MRKVLLGHLASKREVVVQQLRASALPANAPSRA
jgi:hypothetical protein